MLAGVLVEPFGLGVSAAASFGVTAGRSAGVLGCTGVVECVGVVGVVAGGDGGGREGRGGDVTDSAGAADVDALGGVETIAGEGARVDEVDADRSVRVVRVGATPRLAPRPPRAATEPPRTALPPVPAAAAVAAARRPTRDAVLVDDSRGALAAVASDAATTVRVAGAPVWAVVDAAVRVDCRGVVGVEEATSRRGVDRVVARVAPGGDISSPGATSSSAAERIS